MQWVFLALFVLCAAALLWLLLSDWGATQQGEAPGADMDGRIPPTAPI